MSTCPRTDPPDEVTLFQFIMLLLFVEIICLAAPIISSHFRIHECSTLSYAFLWSIQAIDEFVNLQWQFFRIALSISNRTFISQEPFLHPFCSSFDSPFPSRWWYNFSPMISVKSFHIMGRQVIGESLFTIFASLA